MPSHAQESVARELAAEVEEGRGARALRAPVRAGWARCAPGYAELLGWSVDDLALATGHERRARQGARRDGDRAGRRVVTSDRQAPGLIGPLIAARHRGAHVRAVPFAELAEGGVARAPRWSRARTSTGAPARSRPFELAEVDVPVILDGAQGAGAVPVDVAELGCAVYAAAGQKWLCGADGTGLLYVAPGFRDQVRATTPVLHLPSRTPRSASSRELKPDARRYDTPALAREVVAFSLAALEVLRGAGMSTVLGARPGARGRARRAAPRARPHRRPARAHDAGGVGGRRPRGPRASAFKEPPTSSCGTSRARRYVRASVGAWSSKDDLDRAARRALVS